MSRSKARKGQPLTQREAQVLSRVLQGKPNKEIAFELAITEGVVKQYMNHIFKKVGFKNRTEAALWFAHRKPRLLGVIRRLEEMRDEADREQDWAVSIILSTTIRRIRDSGDLTSPSRQ